MSKRSEYIVKRVLSLFPVVIGATLIVYFLININGNPVRIMLGPMATPERVEEVRQTLGLNQPVYLRYFYWLANVAELDLGTSIRTGEPVITMIGDRLFNTIVLAGSGLLIALLFAIPAGAISAVKQDTKLDYISRGLSVFWISMPLFWLGLLLALIFSVTLDIFPVYGKQGPFTSVAGIKSLVLPALTLGLPQIALYTRLTRSSMLDAMQEDFITTARGKGIREWSVVVSHGLRNALIPVVTMVALRVPWIFGGSVLTEEVFAWPGIGRLLANSILKNDYPTVMGVVLVIIILVVIANLLADIMYAYLDPRIEYQ